jgi:flavin-dependent dehydrogenase
LRGAKPSSAERGAVTASRRLYRVFRGRTVLAGDASGSVDAIVGQGLSLSFHHALALAEAFSTGDLAAYELEHSRLSQRPAFTASLLLLLDRHPVLRHGILRLMAGYPLIFTNLLRFGVTRPTGVALRQLPTLITSK